MEKFYIKRLIVKEPKKKDYAFLDDHLEAFEQAYKEASDNKTELTVYGHENLAIETAISLANGNVSKGYFSGFGYVWHDEWEDKVTEERYIISVVESKNRWLL